MIAISRNSWWVAIRTVFFAPAPERSAHHADVIGCIQTAKRDDETFQLVRTLHIDLTQTRERLFADLGKSTKNQVNRAEKHDRLTCKTIAQPQERDILAFRDFYNIFARSKGTTLCRRYQLETLRLLMRQNGVVITSVSDTDGQALCYHVYVADGTRAMLLYSGSHFRRMEQQPERKRLARAHRLLHWQDILFFKAQGFGVYDFGGLTDDPRVEEFKRSFGGRDVSEYTGYVPVTWKGRVAARYRDLLSSVRRHLFSPREAA